ncbi:MAG: type II toxin-antitoxin system VapB family antitoxin [bacterium]
MQTAKLFNNGRSQAVRLPKDCRLDGKEVFVKKFDNIVMLIPKGNPWLSLMQSLDKFSNDFMNDRKQPAQQKRKPLP